MANLKIYINPKSQAALTSEFLAGNIKLEQSLIFDEKAQKIYLAGDTYSFHTLTDTQYTKLAEVVTDLGEGTIANIKTNIGPLKDTGITLPENTATTVTNLLKALQDEIGNLSATGITLEQGVDATVENLLKALQGRLATVEGDYLPKDSDLTSAMSATVTTNINSTIGGLTGTATGGNTGVTGTASHIKVTVSSQSGQVSNVTVNEDDIASASALSTLDESAVKNINGATGNTVVIDGTDILVGNSAIGGATSAYAGDSISVAINALKGLIDDLSDGEGGESLSKKLAKLDQIYAELTAQNDADGSASLTTVIDALRALKLQTAAYVGVGADGNANEGENTISLQASLENLGTLIQNYKINNSLQNATEVGTAIDNKIGALGGTATGGADGVTGSASHIKVTVTSQSGQVSSVTVNEKDIASAADLAGVSGAVATLQNNAKTVALSNTGATSSTSAYIKITEANNEYTVETTQALDNAINGVVSWNVISPSV